MDETVDAAALRDAVLTALGRRRVDEALVLARQAVAGSPSSALAWHAAAAALARQRRWDDAQACVARARALVAGHPDDDLVAVLDRLDAEIEEGRRRRWGLPARSRH